ncbi:MAG: HesA/MoeB/ThiF family protein [Candidatus Bathyarchaeota archaeon]|nr:HesA/MoeB/ThiF family protein [Candidatus Termiticorpusculum sp.]
MNETEKTNFAEEYYKRQVTMKEIGNKGQQKLSKSRVAIVGVGGLGTVSALYLTLAGVGYIRVIDHDTIEPHNLHRQILYTPDNLHQPKAKIAANRLQQINPLIKVEAVTEKIQPNNTERLLTEVDCVVDGLDNMQTRYTINRACVKTNTPYIFGAATGMEGNLTVFTPPKTGCLECLIPNHPTTTAKEEDTQIQTQNTTRGVIGATPGIIGSLQAIETIKLLTNTKTNLKGKLLICDFTDMDFTTINLTKNTQCPTCHNKNSKNTKTNY